MKKIILILLVVLISFNLFACSSNNNDDSANKDSDTLNVEKELFDVTITIPASWYEDSETEITQEALDEQYTGEGYKSATLNDDGSVTIVMTKSQHKQMMKEIEDSIETSLQELVDNEDYTFNKIEHNDDYSIFTATLNADEVGFAESFTAILFVMCGNMYNIFNGTETDEIKVRFCNAEGSLISEISSDDMTE